MTLKAYSALYTGHILSAHIMLIYKFARIHLHGLCKKTKTHIFHILYIAAAPLLPWKHSVLVPFSLKPIFPKSHSALIGQLIQSVVIDQPLRSCISAPEASWAAVNSIISMITMMPILEFHVFCPYNKKTTNDWFRQEFSFGEINSFWWWLCAL